MTDYDSSTTERAVALFQPRAEVVVLDTGSAGTESEWTTFELMAEWDRAMAAWLESRKSPKTRSAYRAAVEDFFSFRRIAPWEVVPNDVHDWRRDMETREWENDRSGQSGIGLSAATVAQRLAGLSSFFSYTQRSYWVTMPNGRQRPLGDRNPVQAVDRPEVKAFEHASYLTEEQAGQLLNAIPRHTVGGLRDYAMILAYILTGRRAQEIRNLTWGNLRPRGGGMQYHWTGKGKERWDLLPPPVWAAIETYLRKAGRLEEMQDEDFLFVPLTDRARRLPGVSSSWEPEGPLSAREVRRIVKRYAKKAGLNPADVHVHTLRHTAAELYKANGDDIYTVSKLLNHSSVKVTQGYFDHMEGHNNVTWRKVAAGLQLRGDW